MSEQMGVLELVKGAIRQKEFESKEGRKKTTFWPTDCLKPSVEIFWNWMDVPKTNPIEAESLLLMKVGKLYELAIGEYLTEAGCAVKTTEGQARVFYQRWSARITGYMDFVHPDGYPIEIKSISTFGAMRMAKGAPPSDQYCYQVACYMDFLKVDKGLIIHCCRDDGALFESNVIRRPDGLFECKGFVFDVESEYKRFNSLYQNNIVTKIQPPLDYEYHPAITEQLLASFVDSDSDKPYDKIKKAIKGERILSDDRWRPQYCNWKELWIDLEAKMKGCPREDLLTYKPHEIEAMMQFLGVEEKTDKNGKKSLRAIKGLDAPCKKYLKPKEEAE